LPVESSDISPGHYDTGGVGETVLVICTTIGAVKGLQFPCGVDVKIDEIASIILDG